MSAIRCRKSKIRVDNPNIQKMKHLCIDSKYLRKILRGEKKSTIRLKRKKMAKFSKGETVLINSGGKIVAKALIKDCKAKKVSELSDEDAKKDGFANKDELLRALKKHYRKRLTDNAEVTIIEFEITEKFTEAMEPEIMHYGKYKPKEIAKLALEHLKLEKADELILKMLVENKGSIRSVARRLGGLEHRRIVRDVLRKAYEELKEVGIIDSEHTKKRE